MGAISDIIQWATDPWVRMCLSTSHGSSSGRGHRRPVFLGRARHLARYFAKREKFAGRISPELPSACPHASRGTRLPRGCFTGSWRRLCSHSFSRHSFQRSACSSIGDLPLDRRYSVNYFHPVSCDPCLVLAGLLGHLADKEDIQDAWKRIRRFIGQPAPPPRRFAKYPLENKLYHGAIVATGLSAILTGVFMLFRVRTGIFPRNPYLFSDMTWA